MLLKDDWFWCDDGIWQAQDDSFWDEEIHLELVKFLPNYQSYYPVLHTIKVYFTDGHQQCSWYNKATDRSTYFSLQVEESKL